MEKMGPSSLKSEKMRSDLIKDHKESHVVEERKTLGHRFASKYSGAFPHQLGLGGSSPPPWFLAAAAGGEDDDEDQEKMDMLWEDFNEELASAPPLCPLSPAINRGGGLTMKEEEMEAWLDVDDELVLVDLEKRAKRLHSPKDGRVVRRRRWSMALMLRLLKKLFLVKKSRNNPRTAPI